eukprot:2998711-Pyramimonas_sp.AAC.1
MDALHRRAATVNEMGRDSHRNGARYPTQTTLQTCSLLLWGHASARNVQPRMYFTSKPEERYVP